MVRHLARRRHDQLAAGRRVAVQQYDSYFVPLRNVILDASVVQGKCHADPNLVQHHGKPLHTRLPLPELSQVEPRRTGRLGSHQREAARARLGPGVSLARQPTVPGYDHSLAAQQWHEHLVCHALQQLGQLVLQLLGRQGYQDGQGQLRRSGVGHRLRRPRSHRHVVRLHHRRCRCRRYPPR